LSTGFVENIDNATTNEVCTDYNVGLVGALGYIVSKLAPVDTSKFGSTSALHARGPSPVEFSARAEGRALILSSSEGLQDVVVTDLLGRELVHAAPAASSFRWTATAPGLYLTRVRTAGGWASSKVLVQ
jgi:hypothetical protein